MSRLRKLLVTTGDTDGIGLEVSLKALNLLAGKKSIVYFIYLSAQFVSAAKKILKGFDVISASSFLEAGTSLSSHLSVRGRLTKKSLVYLIGKENSPPEWVEEAAELTRDQVVDAMITAPLSKTLIQKNLKKLKVSKFKSPIRGHTEILNLVDATNEIHMVFLGSEFNVFLGTAHVPLREVADLVIDRKRLKKNLSEAAKFRTYLKSKKPIGVLGLNPHAGENGLLGHEDEILRKTISASPGVFAGPIPADSAFIASERKKYCFYLCWYHDQGLIPFKTVHEFRSGVHISWGLSFLRTSVDHGTAKNIYGKNLADANSMREAIEFAIKGGQDVPTRHLS